MNSIRRFSVVVSAFVVCASIARAQGSVPDPFVLGGKIADWPAPAAWSPDRVSGGISTMGAVTSPLPFIGLAPCRIVDTRGNGAPIQGGMFTGGSDVRDYAVAGICGIPGSAQALSLNFTVVGPTGSGFLVAWPTGGAVPPVSILNFNAGDVVNNAAVVPTSVTTSFTVNVSAPTHVIIDINGYYAPAGVDGGNTFLGLGAGNFTMAGGGNTGLGSNALSGNATGSGNTATGFSALSSNTSGGGNTAIGTQALASTLSGISNTATGIDALLLNTTGSNNTATGAGALWNTTGSNNIAIGSFTGFNLTTGNDNIDVANAGIAGESATIRIGEAGTHARAFLAGVRGATTGVNDAVAVLVDSAGQLGTNSSSRRVKQDISDMAGTSQALMKLRPVTFRYKPSLDPSGSPQYGLIAEEVAEVFPDLVVYDKEGLPEMVRYHVLPSLLLNEAQRQQRTIEKQRGEIADLRERLERLEVLLSGFGGP